MITLLIKTQISRYRAEYENGTSDLISCPGQLLRQINLELLKTQTNKHATLFYGILNTVEDRMSYSMAAHFPSPIISTETGCKMIEPEALAVGLFEDAAYETRKLDMKGFKSLTLLSDGIFELMEDKTLAEKEARLLELGAQPTHTMYDYLAKLRKNGQTMNAPDDITVLTVEKS